MTQLAPRTGYRFLDDPGPVLAFAHRGGAHHPDIIGLENTLTAFRHAVGLGYRYLETDVRATRDGVVLAFHDPMLDRVTDRSGLIALTSAAEVREARLGSSRMGETEHIPTFAELFDEFPDARFNVDIKDMQAVHPLADFIEARGAHDRILVGSFSPARLREFRRLTRGRVPTSAGPLEVLTFWRQPGRVANVLTRGRVAALQVPHRWGPLALVTPGFVRRAHDAGVQVHVWTVDEPDEMHELLDMGVDGLMTDRTDLLRDVLLSRGRWQGHP